MTSFSFLVDKLAVGVTSSELNEVHKGNFLLRVVKNTKIVNI